MQVDAADQQHDHKRGIGARRKRKLGHSVPAARTGGDMAMAHDDGPGPMMAWAATVSWAR